MTRRLATLVLLLSVTLAGRPMHAQEPETVVRGLTFRGNHALDGATLRAAIGTTNSSWFARKWFIRWLGLGEKRTFDATEFRRDVLRLTLLYRQSGFMDVKVDTVVQRSEKDIRLTFRITEGPPVVVSSLKVRGLDSLPPHDRNNIRQDVPLHVGRPFDRFLFQASADTIISRLRNLGYPGAEVYRTYNVDLASHDAKVSLEAVPGPLSAFGAVTVVGAQKVDTTFIRQLLPARPGQRFSQQDIFQSQRKLYQTQLFRLATVTIDSATYQPESGMVPLTVVVAEGPPHRVRSSVGFATNDCFRGGAGYTDRNLFGTGRLFDLSARVGKVGVGRPFDAGLDRSICSSLKDDTIASARATYNVTASILQPRFFSPLLTSTYSLFAERRSEFKVYRREEIGASFGLRRETSRNVPMSVGYRLAYGNTIASNATFCAFFNACTPADAGRLRQKRVLGVVSAGISWPRANNPLDPTRGHIYAFDVNHSSRFTGSERLQEFTRVTGDMAWYKSLSRSVVLSGHLRGGLVFSPSVSLDSASGSFIPPEQRFYAGGPNDVRGYDLNGLGPVVYVLSRDALTVPIQDSLQSGTLRPRFSATGGNTLAIGQVELRVPSPVWGGRLKLAFFVDGGTLYERGKTQLAPVQLRVTPGVGLRISTPLGPARFDVGYNGYDQPPGALYLQKTDGSLELVQSDFVQKRSSRFSYHFSFGQPF